MSYYHIEGNGSFKNLPERILVREDGYLGAYKFYGEPIVDYWYVPEAENAKLREQLEYDRQTSRSRLERIDQLKAENAKLRELVNSYADSFDRYAAMNNGCGPYYSGEDWLALANDMRIELAECCGELGVEVDDA